ncbi:hypothetical protein SAVERM_164 [Streptomyces avermitilis MA-4680 = NBRC 14893]|uniref:Uncharacterized protein n=1 Tax=Streptomyces avermitilis (strain ATCC 31267 / DSM 46492 / JCM 5070 / NBRC 14893 / NCIMB 12804 / NRRL 8165 / MA-4680) TaxID=227882 RepID=Q82RH9_STRAW|nr:hypothetical protein SAVERM_164 [Streptomyces avermitilis MA-4680 = NBRC 14893]
MSRAKWVRTRCRHGSGSSPSAQRPVRCPVYVAGGCGHVVRAGAAACGPGRLPSTVRAPSRYRILCPYVRVRPAETP